MCCKIKRNVLCIIQGCSSVGRVLVSKTMGRGFESFRPCQKTRNVHSGIPCFFVRGWVDSKGSGSE